MKEKINNSTITVGDLNTPLTPMNSSMKQKINIAGTSESLLDIRGNDVLRRLISGLERGLGTFDSTIESELTTGTVSGAWKLPAKYCAYITRGCSRASLYRLFTKRDD